MGGGVVEPPSNPTPFPGSVFANIDKPDKETGNGLYTVDHSQDKDTTLGDEWKEKPEYRYAGPDPDNYVWFNSDAECTKEGDEDNKHCELWRIIGLVNVKVKDDAGERIEQRIKTII